jgi:signal transduction histidine kinase
MRRRLWPIATVVAMFLVVATFVAATLIVRWHSTSGDGALSLAQNGAPSLRLLGRARGDLRELRLAARTLETSPKDERALAELQRARRQLGNHLAAEKDTPLYPGEEASSQGVDEALARLDSKVAGLVSAAPPANGGAVGVAAEEFDRRLEELHDVNATALQHDATAMLTRQHTSLGLALVLDAIGLALASLVTLGLVLLARRVLKLENDRCHEAEQRATELNAFSARVAHDLMSPLATVALSLGVGARRSAQSEAMMERANRALQRARTMVDGLLDFSRAGGQPSPDARAPVPPVVAGVVDEAQPQAVQKEITLTHDVVPECSVACAPGILAVILGNLIDNALKHMDDGGERRVHVGVERHAGRVRFQVDDTGPGLPVGFEKIAFDPYRRARENLPGLGLGLATVKRLVEAHHGRVGVSTRHPSGSSFWVELPRAAELGAAGEPVLRPQPAG